MRVDPTSLPPRIISYTYSSPVDTHFGFDFRFFSSAFAPIRKGKMKLSAFLSALPAFVFASVPGARFGEMKSEDNGCVVWTVIESLIVISTSFSERTVATFGGFTMTVEGPMSVDTTVIEEVTVGPTSLIEYASKVVVETTVAVSTLGPADLSEMSFMADVATGKYPFFEFSFV